MTHDTVARALAERALFVSHGDFYAATIVRDLAVDGLVRVGCAAYTTEEEIERLLRAVEEISDRSSQRAV
jgi:selenocysteine lyase/cysteine desulfurase